MMRGICIVMLAVLPTIPAGASCAIPLPYCQRVPDRTNPNAAVFVGVVRQVVTPVFTPPQPLPPGTQQPGLASSRRRAGDPAPQVEYKYPTARLQVLENFLGADTPEFEVRLTSDHFLNGIPEQVPPLAEGEVWFIEAYKDQRDQQWTVSSCGRSKPAAQADEDLRFLRAWLKGEVLPAHFDGSVFDPNERKFLPGISVYLRSAKQTFSAVTDLRGRFTFQDLPHDIYEASAALPQGGGPFRIDLTQASCAERMFSIR